MNPNQRPAEQLDRELAEIEDWFRYHAPTPAQQIILEECREQVRALARWYVTVVGNSRERAIGLTQLRLAVMALNQGIIFSRDD